MTDKKRRPYRKPEMEQVKLVPEEAVLSICKTTSGGGIGVTGGISCLVGQIQSCSINGS